MAEIRVGRSAPRIRSAKPSEAAAISELAFRSKAHWRYTPEQMAVFRGELTLRADEVTGRRTHVLEEAGELVGFYRALGARLEREIPSSVPGRSIPTFTLKVAASPPC